jgi:hypothetical protein
MAAAEANWFAYFALLAWPVVAVLLYQTRPFSEATLWTILGALLLLPSHADIKIPMIPAIDKNSVGNLAALAGCFMLAPHLKRLGSSFGLTGLLATMYIVGPVVTSAINNDTIVMGSRVLPGVGYYDGISALLSQSVFFLPFVIGRHYLQKSEDNETILRALVLAGLLYSLPMLFEVRMSPQLSKWIYGYFPSAFAVESRYGGFRPVVFMINGLSAAFFLSTAFIAAAALWRNKTSVGRLHPIGVNAYLGVVVLLCKSAGALVYAVVIGLFVRWLRPKAQLRIAIVIVSIGLLYPLLRMADYFPDNQLVDFAATFSQERADSLKIRFDQEQKLLAHASERFWFGWGRYGRNRVYDESGKDSSITDGLWIITLGQFGFVGFIAQFGLMTLPVFRAAGVLKFAESRRETIFLSALTLILALTVIEQLPNASISPWSWLLAGALLGRCESLRAVALRTRRSISPGRATHSTTTMGGAAPGSRGIVDS